MGVTTRQAPKVSDRERTWKLVTTITGVLGVMLVRKLMRAAYRAIRNDTAPAKAFDPTDARFSWPPALLWAAAAGVGVGIARVLSTRVAAIGWEIVTGASPPGTSE